MFDDNFNPIPVNFDEETSNMDSDDAVFDDLDPLESDEDLKLDEDEEDDENDEKDTGDFTAPVE